MSDKNNIFEKYKKLKNMESITEKIYEDKTVNLTLIFENFIGYMIFFIISLTVIFKNYYENPSQYLSQYFELIDIFYYCILFISTVMVIETAKIYFLSIYKKYKDKSSIIDVMARRAKIKIELDSFLNNISKDELKKIYTSKIILSNCSEEDDEYYNNLCEDYMDYKDETEMLYNIIKQKASQEVEINNL